MNLRPILHSGPMAFLLLVLLQAPLVFNPGWFSHDELQWAARADVARFADLPWVAWSNWLAFQYRPITFNLWLLLSYLFFATPYLMHGVFVGLGSLNALLLAAVLEGAGVERRVALAAAAIFVLSPFVAYVHGWVGTLADLLVLLVALLGLRLLQGMTGMDDYRDALATAATMLLMAAALFCKESAVVLPLALLPALYRHPYPRRALVAIVLSSVPALAYLLLRIATLLASPVAHAGYAWSLQQAPLRLAEYLLFPFMPPLLEVGATLDKSPLRLLAAAVCLALLLVALARRGWHWPLAWLGLVAALLGPVLILATSYRQYAYLASAAAVGIAATAWERLGRLLRAALALVMAVTILHGASVMGRMHAVGVVQHNFDTDLRHLLAHGIEAPLIAPAASADRWMLERFLHEVPTYGHARLAKPGRPATFIMQRDGHLVPIHAARGAAAAR
ncbi:MAG: hypothetical protein J0H15_08975 [Xanthomonadales bacterium]|nr:hypothetical protein [Xanthomonadales bacterium]